jgi:hypothetical protein
MVSNTLRIETPDTHAMRLRLPWALLGLLLAIDQLLLPMLHAGGLPYKVSYFVCGLWLIHHCCFGFDDAARAADFRGFALAIGAIAAASLLGELLLRANYPVEEDGQALRSLLIYVLGILSFGLGLSARRFPLSALIWILLTALALNFAFIFLKSAVPQALIDLYYSDKAVNTLADLADSGIRDVRDILELARPRGLFGNPNMSALLVNIIVLFIHLGLRHRLMRAPGPVLGLAIVVLPVALSIALASRGEFVVACLLAVLNYRLLFRGYGPARRLRMLALTALLPVIAAIGVFQVLGGRSLQVNLERALSVLTIIDKVSEGTDDEREVASVARPLLTLQRMWVRLKFSPIFGTGYSATQGVPFAEGTEFFHNDWFRVLATSGLVGFVVVLWIIRKYCLPLGWVTFVPFVLPALVNTFVLSIPAFMFYFFMIANLREQLRQRAEAAAAR